MMTKDRKSAGKTDQEGNQQTEGAETFNDPTEVRREFYTVEMLAAAINKTPVTVRRWLRSGDVKGVRIGRAWMIPRAEYEKWKKLAEADEEKENTVVGDGIYLMGGVGEREFSTLFALFKPKHLDVEVQPLLPEESTAKGSKWTVSHAIIADGGEVIFFGSLNMRYVGFFRKGIAHKVKQSLSLFNPAVLLAMIRSATHCGYPLD